MMKAIITTQRMAGYKASHGVSAPHQTPMSWFVPPGTIVLWGTPGKALLDQWMEVLVEGHLLPPLPCWHAPTWGCHHSAPVSATRGSHVEGGGAGGQPCHNTQQWMGGLHSGVEIKVPVYIQTLSVEHPDGALYQQEGRRGWWTPIENRNLSNSTRRKLYTLLENRHLWTGKS